MKVLRLGRYEIIERLGRGGMAEVFLARTRGPHGFAKLVAIKRLFPHLADDAASAARFLDEARLAARFNHANLVQVFELGEVDGTYFVAMEFVDGADVGSLLSAGGAVGWGVAARVTMLAARGLHYAHSFHDPNGRPLHLVHRDVSPQNIMVNLSGGVKVVDFGIARAAVNRYHTKTVGLRGKLAYMSPEQVQQNGTLDARSDVYALGVCLYEMVTGKRLHGERTELEIMHAILHESLPLIAKPDIPRELDTIVQRATAKAPQKRYANAAELARALEQLLARQAPEVDEHTLALLVSERRTTRPDYQVPEAPEVTERSRPPARRRGSRRWARNLGVGVVLTLALVTSYVATRRPSAPAAIARTSVRPSPAAAPSLPEPTIRAEPPVAHEPVTPPRSAVEAPRPRVGWMRVTTVPSTQVWIDERRIGTTPIERSPRLITGVHAMRFVDEAQGVRVTENVRIEAGKTLDVVRHFGRGQLELFVKPYGEVWVDGVSHGLSPLEAPVSLWQGRHTVRVANVELGRETTREIDIEPDQTLRLNLDLR
ncbi:MAG: protein kinase [Myxococcota bacterium]